MKKFRRAKCPYCSKKLSLLQLWTIKTQGEYQCPKCSNFSDIKLDSSIQILAILAVIVSGLIYVVGMFIMKGIDLFLILIMILPYLIFYLLSIFLVRLRNPVIRKKKPNVPMRPQRVGNRLK